MYKILLNIYIILYLYTFIHTHIYTHTYMYTLLKIFTYIETHTRVFMYIQREQARERSLACGWEECFMHTGALQGQTPATSQLEIMRTEMQTEVKCLPRFNLSNSVSQAISISHQLITSLVLPNNCENTYPEQPLQWCLLLSCTWSPLCRGWSDPGATCFSCRWLEQEQSGRTQECAGPTATSPQAHPH